MRRVQQAELLELGAAMAGTLQAVKVKAAATTTVRGLCVEGVG